MRVLPTLLCIVVFSAELPAQTDTTNLPPSHSFGIIDTVIVIGNEKTKESIIIREMTLKPGMEATSEAMDYDRGRIYSIGLFTSVDLSIVPFEGKNLLIVDVKERWYIIPLPLFGFREGDTKKPYFGAGLLHNNFRGLNQKLYGSLVLGYNPSLELQFYDPWIDRKNNLYLGTDGSFSRIRNKSTDASGVVPVFDEIHYDANASFGKRFTLYESVGISLGYQIVDVTDNGPGRTVAGNGTDRFLYGGIAYSLDTRDLRDYSTQGTFLSLYATKYGFGESEVSYTRFGADLRRFVPLPFDFTFAARIQGSVVAGGYVPPYAHTYFGYNERIRGYFKTVFEGENIAGTSIELRWPLLKPRVITFTAIPIPQEFAVWRFGISLEAFADAGTTWFRGNKLTLSSLASGYGAGIAFLLPYDFVVRTEYAWNEYGKGQIILDVRSSF